MSALTVDVRQWHCCVSGVPEHTARDRVSSPRRLPADVRSAVYAVGAQTPRGWDFLLGKYRLHSFHLEKNNMEFALSLTERQDELRW